MVPALALLWYLLGVFLSKTKRNWFVGIRTPWTLSSDEVWDKTHALSAQLFKLVGILSLVGIFFSNAISIFFILVPAIGVTIAAVVYSYVAYRQLR